MDKSDKLVSRFSIDFRDLVVKVVKEEFSHDKSSHIDPVALAEQHKLLLDNVNGFVLVANYVIGGYEFVSNGFYSNLGFDISKLSKEQMTDFVISVIKEDHRDFMVGELLPVVLTYLREHATLDTGLDYRYTCSLKLRNVKGEYQWYLVDTVLIQVDDHGFPIRTLVTATNINQVKKDDCLYYNITKRDEHGIYQVVYEGVGRSTHDNFDLTRRELQIINLICKGLTNKEIADHLFISVNTVQTHRKSIMKKTQTKGIADLALFAFSRGLL
jgi:DNA-binding CsgD family transcriptional regulator